MPKTSSLEARFDLYWRLLHPELPAPELHYCKAIPGRRLELDFAWPAARFGVELQGGTWAETSKRGHTRGSMYERDCIKLNLMQANGWVVIWLTSSMLRADPGKWLSLIATMVMERGA